MPPLDAEWVYVAERWDRGCLLLGVSMIHRLRDLLCLCMTPDPESAWLPVPVERSGGGGDIADGPVIEAQPYGYHGSGLTFSLNAQLSSLEKPLVKLGVPAQQQAYLPGLVSLSSSGWTR